jgi:hypothetical protein
MTTPHVHLEGTRRVLAVKSNRRYSVVLFLVCVATFVAVIFFFKDEGAGSTFAEGAAIADQDIGYGAGVGQQSSTPAELRGPLSTLPVATATRSPYPARIESATDPQQLPAEVSGIEDADARATVISELGTVATPESLNLLEQTVRNDHVARNRLLAVNSLRLMAKGGDAGGEIRALLRRAMADSDPNVAASARDTYRELVP